MGQINQGGAIGILFPMEFEAEPIWKKLGGSSQVESGFETIRGTWDGVTILSARIGMGHLGQENKVDN